LQIEREGAFQIVQRAFHGAAQTPNSGAPAISFRQPWIDLDRPVEIGQRALQVAFVAADDAAKKIRLMPTVS